MKTVSILIFCLIAFQSIVKASEPKTIGDLVCKAYEKKFNEPCKKNK